MEDPVSIEFLRQVVSYDPKSGELRWKERPLESFAREADLKIWNARRLGKIAFDKHLPGIKAAMQEVSAKLAERLITEGFVAVQNGEIVDIRARETDLTP